MRCLVKKDSFIFYKSFAEAIDDLPDEDQLKIYRAIKEYALYEREAELSGIAKGFWTLIKPQIEANNRRYINGVKGAEYGKNGGRPKKETPTAPNNNPYGVVEENPKETPNDNVNVNENKNDNEVSVFSENKQEENPKPRDPIDPLPDKPSKTKEDATIVFSKARELWNERGLKPECRNIFIPPAEYDCLITFQRYTWLEIENAIKNYHWHKTGQCGSGWKQPPPYGSIYGFLKKGVEKYFDDNALDTLFKEWKANGQRKQG